MIKLFFKYAFTIPLFVALNFKGICQEYDSLFIKVNSEKLNKKKVDLFFKPLASKKTPLDVFKKLSIQLDSIAAYFNHDSDVAYFISGKARIANIKGDTKAAMENYFSALKIYERLRDTSGIILMKHEIGTTLRENKNYTTALPHLYASLKLSYASNNIKHIGGNHAIIGTTYKDLGKTDSSLFHHKIALKYRLLYGKKSYIAAIYNDIGLTYKAAKKHEESLEYLNKALEIREEINDKMGVSGTCINIGNTLKRLMRYQKARDYFDRGIRIAKETNFYNFYLNGLSGRAENALLMKDFETAANDYHIYTNAKDSIYKANLEAQLSELDVKYQSEKKDAEIILQDEQLKHKSEQNQIQKTLTLAATIALIMALIAVFFVFKSYKQNKRNSKKLEVKNQVIEIKNKEITDSLNYAKLIQQSLLASQELLDENLSEYFILYKPKDIVSGDFYWASKCENGFLIACVDCTGHGVPGAFMSLIGKENLDKAIAKTTKPGEILTELNKGVKNSLNQNSNNGNRDGMDAALLKIKYTNSGADLTYAGANRPLYVLQNDKTLSVTNATKTAIGGLTPSNQIYTEHQFKINKGETLIIASDGYADQFGSDNNKKLTTKRFKDLLISIQDKSALEQKQYLDDFFTTWKGNHEQLDDLLVIGIKV